MTATSPLQRFPFAPPSRKPDAPQGWIARVRPGWLSASIPTPTGIVLSFALAAISVCSLWFVLFATVLSPLQEQHAQHNSYALFREELTQLSPRTAPLGGRIAPDSPVAMIDAPELGLKDVVIVEGTASGDLTRGPGHRRDTALPGQAGTATVYGRANLFGGPFGKISHAHPGDVITMTTGQGLSKYVVEQVRYPGDALPVPLQSGEGRLTLITSEGGALLNGYAPTHQVYVDAKLQSTFVNSKWQKGAYDTPSGRPSGIPKAEKSLSGDIGALFMLVLWLPLLGLAALAIIWAQARWGRWQTWLVGAPALVAALWGVSETAVQLLPNLM